MVAKRLCCRCNTVKKIACHTPADLCQNCYRIIKLEEKKTGIVWVPPGTPPLVKQPISAERTKSHADILLETIIKENKIQKIKVEFEISIKIDGIKVTSI